MNKERLLILANHLKTVKPETFDLGTWKCARATVPLVTHAVFRNSKY